MKRLILFALVFCLSLSCAACNSAEQNQLQFYFLRSQDTIEYGEPDALIVPVPREISPETALDDALQLYLSSPTDANLRNPFPKGTYLLSTILREDLLVIVLSREFSSLDGIRLTLAGACLAATCHEMTGIEQIQVRSGENIYDFHYSDFIFLDEIAGE